jgi:Zn-dependent protease
MGIYFSGDPYSFIFIRLGRIDMSLFGNLNEFLIRILYMIPAVLIGFSFHEFAHAFVADKLGDPTPGNQGRLTLSPRSHIDLFGIILIFIANIGWAKPVQINRSYFKHPRRDDILVSVAGPTMNLIVAIVSLIILKFLSLAPGSFITLELSKLTMSMICINILLFIFNLIPIPPLDGFHILENISPPRFYKQLSFLNQYGLIILFVFIFFLGHYTILPIRNVLTSNMISLVYPSVYSMPPELLKHLLISL